MTASRMTISTIVVFSFPLPCRHQPQMGISQGRASHYPNALGTAGLGFQTEVHESDRPEVPESLSKASLQAGRW